MRAIDSRDDIFVLPDIFSQDYMSPFFFTCRRFSSSADVFDEDGVVREREDRTPAIISCSLNLPDWSSPFHRLSLRPDVKRA